MLCSSLDLRSLTTSSDTLGGEELSHVPMLRLTPSIGLRTSKLKRPLAPSEVTFSWIAEQDGYTKSREIKMIGLGVNQHKAKYWIELVNTKAVLESGHPVIHIYLGVTSLWDRSVNHGITKQGTLGQE
jgi:hypothetical protein